MYVKRKINGNRNNINPIAIQLLWILKNFRQFSTFCDLAWWGDSTHQKMIFHTHPPPVTLRITEKIKDEKLLNTGNKTG